MRTARTNGISVTALAKQFGVHRGTVWTRTKSEQGRLGRHATAGA